MHATCRIPSSSLASGSVPRTIRAAGGHTWSVFHRDLTPEKVREAQSLGLKVLAWTVNDPARMGELIDWRLDGLVTDRPDLARAEMARRETIMEGRVPRNTLRADIDFARAEALTTYGRIGIKVWIYKGEVMGDIAVEAAEAALAQTTDSAAA